MSIRKKNKSTGHINPIDFRTTGGNFKSGIFHSVIKTFLEILIYIFVIWLIGAAIMMLLVKVFDIR